MNKTLRDEVALAVLPSVIIAVATTGKEASLEDKVKLAFIFADEFIKQKLEHEDKHIKLGLNMKEAREKYYKEKDRLDKSYE